VVEPLRGNAKGHDQLAIPELPPIEHGIALLLIVCSMLQGVRSVVEGLSSIEVNLEFCRIWLKVDWRAGEGISLIKQERTSIDES
jgi:hypothetical protein